LFVALCYGFEVSPVHLRAVTSPLIFVDGLIPRNGDWFIFRCKCRKLFSKNGNFYKKYEIILPVLEIIVFLQRISERNKR